MKKKTLYSSPKLFLLATLFLFTISCSKKEAMVTPQPSITSISPQTGTEGTEVSINGDNFGNDISEAKVSFGNKNATITSFSKQSIKVQAPSGFNDVDVNVSVSVGSSTSNGVQFTYTDTSTPTITSMTSTGFYNSTVTIFGRGFSPVKTDNVVKFGTITATVIEATNGILRVTTPDLGAATSADVTVTNRGLTSNARTINVDADQNKVATYAWTSTVTKPGVIYKTGQFTLFGAVQRRMYVLDVTLNASNSLNIGFTKTNASVTAQCISYNAVAGVNAGYFKLAGTYDKNGYVRINGNEVQAGDLNVNDVFTNAALIINNNVATVRKFTETGFNQNLIAQAIPVSQAENIIVCGPKLITDNEIEDVDIKNAHNSSQTARTGLGVSADGKHVYIVVVDTGGGVTGVSTPQLAKILQALGAVNAMNFDGGGSSTMYVQGQGDGGRVNFPYGDTFQRPVASIIYVK